jgi:hypothetical protein
MLDFGILYSFRASAADQVCPCSVSTPNPPENCTNENPIQTRYRYSLSLFLIVTKTPLSLSLPLSSPPPTTLRAPGEGGALCNGRVEHGRSMDPWLGQFGTGATGATTRRHDTTTTMPDPCSESVPPRRGDGGTEAPQALRHDDTTRQRRCQTPALRACNPRG